ncbi:hypothetical protein Acr_23g0004220 [Actinidia rufa]|uniref:Uncharacterized protein n=1 Tax=Actinidia rufa TaxID=165716 RepID=A0A7J0GMI8_9ERIC|nr:hypothetical protein Acr_23g0004220 [Actinidia rufa]
MATETHEFSPIDEESREGISEMLFHKRRCCFCFPSAGPSWWRRTPAVETGGRWWSRGVSVLKKLREWSEIAAGPRWKTFIRRFNRSKSGSGTGKQRKFQYDPLSYSLNFDDGAGQNDHFDEEYESRNFSSRFAVISSTSSMELGKDTTVFA